MEITAAAKNIRISPQKMRIVADLLREKSPKEALSVLDFIKKRSSPIFKKVIMSAIANAKNNFNLKEESLVFKKILVEIGPTLKRYRPVSRGRAHPILKRTGHIKIVLEGQKETKTSKVQQLPNSEANKDAKNASQKENINNQKETKDKKSRLIKWRGHGTKS